MATKKARATTEVAAHIEAALELLGDSDSLYGTRPGHARRALRVALEYVTAEEEASDGS